MMVEGSPRTITVAAPGVQSGSSIGSPKDQDDRKDRDHTEQGVNCLNSERPRFIPVKQDSTEGQISRWKKLRTTVQLGGAVNQVHKKHCLKREDSFIKRYSARQPPPIHTEVLSSPSQWGGCPAFTVLNPYESLLFWWLWILTLCVLYNAWTLIVRQAFPELQESLSALWYTADGCSDLIFLLDVVVQFRTGYLEQGIMVRDRTQLAKHYIFSKDFFLDLAALTPLDLAQIWIGPFPILRLPRFLKIQRTYHFYYTVESRTAYPNLWRVVNLVHVLLLLAHWFGCFYYMISELENFEGNWSYPQPEKEYSTLTRKYLGSVYWSTLTLTTIGDLATPATNLQYLFTIISYLIGVFIFATIVGQVGNVITNRNASRLEFERLLDGAKLYMRHHKVPREMQRRVQRWYDYSWSRGRMQGGGDINSALGILPDKLKTELALHVNLKTLKKVTIFQECHPEFLYDLVLKMKAYIFTPGDLICRRGEVAREMFIIADGILEVINKDREVLTQMNAGDFFGEIGILNLDGFNRRTADVRSVGYSELFSLSREDVLMAMKDFPDAQAILHSMGLKRLNEAKMKSPGKDEDAGKKSDKSGNKLIENSWNAKNVTEYSKNPGELSVLKKVKENLFPTQAKSDVGAELSNDGSPMKRLPLHMGSLSATDKKFLTSLNTDERAYENVSTTSAANSSTAALFLPKIRRTSMGQGKNPTSSPLLGNVIQRNSVISDVRDNKLLSVLPAYTKSTVWRRFSDVAAFAGLRRESLQSMPKEIKPQTTKFGHTSMQDKVCPSDKGIQKNNEGVKEDDITTLVPYDCTTSAVAFGPQLEGAKAEPQPPCEDSHPSTSDEASGRAQIFPAVLSGKVCGNRRTRKSLQRGQTRSRRRSRRKTGKTTSPKETDGHSGDEELPEGKDPHRYVGNFSSEDPIKLGLQLYFKQDHSKGTKEFELEDIVPRIRESTFNRNMDKFLTKVAEDVKAAMKAYVVQKEGGLWLRILELEEEIRQRDIVIAQLQWQADQIDAQEEEESAESEGTRANESTPLLSKSGESKHPEEKEKPRVSKPLVAERHVKFSLSLTENDDNKPLPLPDIVEYMESSIEDSCGELTEEDLWRVEFPDNDIHLKTTITTTTSWKRPKMRRHSSVEVGSETPMHLLNFTTGAPRVEHLLPTVAEDPGRLTSRRYSESQTKDADEEPQTKSFAARVRKVFKKIKANTEVKAAISGNVSKDSNFPKFGRSSKRLSDGGAIFGDRQLASREEKPRRYSDTLLRSTDWAPSGGESEAASMNTRRIGSEGNLGKTSFRTLPTITEDDFIKKLMSTSFDSSADDGCQESPTTDETQTSCVVELPEDPFEQMAGPENVRSPSQSRIQSLKW